MDVVEEQLKRDLDDAKAKLDAHRQLQAKQRLIIRDYMVSSNLTSTQSGSYSLTVRAGVASVLINDEELIPAEYMVEKVTYSPDKKAIKAAIESGLEVKGAELLYGESSLMVR